MWMTGLLRGGFSQLLALFMRVRDVSKDLLESLEAAVSW